MIQTLLLKLRSMNSASCYEVGKYSHYKSLIAKRTITEEVRTVNIYVDGVELNHKIGTVTRLRERASTENNTSSILFDGIFNAKFDKILRDTILCLEKRFTKYIDDDGSLSLFAVFNVENFPDNIPSLATHGNHQIEQLSERCVRYGYMTVEEAMNARDERPQLKASIHNLKKSISKTSRKINLSLNILSQLLVSNPPNIRTFSFLLSTCQALAVLKQPQKEATHQMTLL